MTRNNTLLGHAEVSLSLHGKHIFNFFPATVWHLHQPIHMAGVIRCFKIKSDKMKRSEFFYLIEMRSSKEILRIFFPHILQKDLSVSLTELRVYFPKSGVGTSQLASWHPDSFWLTTQINWKENPLMLPLSPEDCRPCACFQGTKSH